MSFTQFITNMLNIKEDSIQELLPIEKSDGSINIKVRLKATGTTCPYCKKTVNVHSYKARDLLHSTLVNRKCIITYLQRRYICKFCGITFTEQNPFANSRESMTLETIINILIDLKRIESTFTSVAARHNTTKTKVIRLFDKHVNIPRKKLPRVLSIDEHYFPKSDRDSLYICLLMDFETGIITDVLPDRKKGYLSKYFSYIRAENNNELNNVQYISMDLSELFRNTALAFFPNAIICADSFHVLQNLNKAFRDVRLKCYRSTQDISTRYLLVKFRSVFEHNKMLDNDPRFNRSLNQYINLRGIRDHLFLKFPELEKAYNLKELYINFNSSANINNAKELLEHIIIVFADSGISEYDQFYKLLINWKEEIINSFTVINGRRINNSYIESKNRSVGTLINNANGLHNFERTRNRILYCLNPDDTFKI